MKFIPVHVPDFDKHADRYTRLYVVEREFPISPQLTDKMKIKKKVYTYLYK